MVKIENQYLRLLIYSIIGTSIFLISELILKYLINSHTNFYNKNFIWLNILDVVFIFTTISFINILYLNAPEILFEQTRENLLKYYYINTNLFTGLAFLLFLMISYFWFGFPLTLDNSLLSYRIVFSIYFIFFPLVYYDNLNRVKHLKWI